jgi:MFS family permease
MPVPKIIRGGRSPVEKPEIDRIERLYDTSSKTKQPLQNEDGETVTITLKTWFVIFILSSTFGLSFWPVPTTAAMMAKLAIQFGLPTASVWFVPAYTIANAIGFMLAGADSDLFGRRLFLLFGNACYVLVSSSPRQQMVQIISLLVGRLPDLEQVSHKWLCAVSLVRLSS